MSKHHGDLEQLRATTRRLMGTAPATAPDAPSAPQTTPDDTAASQATQPEPSAAQTFVRRLFTDQH